MAKVKAKQMNEEDVRVRVAKLHNRTSVAQYRDGKNNWSNVYSLGKHRS
jgi:hypothetical protein